MDGVNTYFTIKTFTEYIIPAAIVIIFAVIVIFAFIKISIDDKIVNIMRKKLCNNGYELIEVIYKLDDDFIGRPLCYIKYDEDTDTLHYIKKKDLENMKLLEFRSCLKNNSFKTVSRFKENGGTLKKMLVV